MGYNIIAIKVRGTIIWEFIDFVQSFLLKYICKKSHVNSIEQVVIQIICKNRDIGEQFRYLEKVATLFDELLHLEFFLFDYKDFYIITFINNSYFFINNLSKYYDNDFGKFIDDYLTTQNRSDITEEDIKNQWLVDWLEPRIKEKRYFSVMVFDKDIIENEFLKYINTKFI